VNLTSFSDIKELLKMPDTNTTHDSQSIGISDGAAKQISDLIEKEDKVGMRLRVAVSGGGCSGFQYGFSLDSSTNADDHLFTKNSIEVIVDEVSLEYLNGSELDYVQDLIGSYFSLNNPNASSTCGCGTSFAV
jgi:iron-sulfur cluster insertion protein